MLRPYKNRFSRRGEACFAQRSEVEFKTNFSSFLFLRLPRRKRKGQMLE